MRLNLYKLFVIPFILLLSAESQGQGQFFDDFNVMINKQYGYNLPEYPLFHNIINDYVSSFDVTLYKETLGNNLWEQIYNYPDYGVSFFYSTLGNNEILGEEYAILAFFRLYFLSIHKAGFYNHIGLGVGYTTKKYDQNSNYLNVAVASHFNIHFNYRLGANIQMSEKFKLNAGLAFDHFSNANTVEPNLGVNYVTLYGGVGYLIGKNNPKKTSEIKPHKKKNRYSIFASIGGKRTRSLALDYFLASSLSFELTREFWRKFHMGVGADIFYDSSIEHDFLDDGRDFKPQDSYQTGIHFTLRMVYNKLSLALQHGYYLGLTEKRNNYKFYNRGMIQYQLINHLAIRLTMKSHLHILDFPEIGIGYHL